MVDQVPVRLRGGTPQKLGQFEDGDTVGIDHGGTGQVTAEAALAALGAAPVDDFNLHVNNTNNPHQVTAAQLGAATSAAFNLHLNDTNNPHQVTAAQIGAYTQSQTDQEINSAVNDHSSNTNNPHQVTAAQIGAATASQHNSHVNNTNNPHQVTAAQIGAATASQHNSHVNNINNPHQVTAAQIGATTSTEFNTHINDEGNPHSVTASQVGAPTLSQHNSHVNNTNNPHQVTAAQIGAVSTSQVGSAGGVAPLDGSGLIPTSFLPTSALPSFSVVADSTERQALQVQEGDESLQLDDGSQWIHDGNDWVERPSGGGSGNVSSLDTDTLPNEITLFTDLAGLTIKGGSGLLNTAPGELNGRNIESDGDFLDELSEDFDLHTDDTTNPHSVTASQVGAYTQAETDQAIATAVASVETSLKILELNSTTTQDLNPSNENSIPWDIQEVVDSDVFSHDINSNNSQITILQSGLYLASYNLNGITTQFNRKNPRAYIKVDGSIIGKTSCGVYIRNTANPYGTLNPGMHVLSLSVGQVLQVCSVQAGNGGPVSAIAGSQSFTLLQVRSF